VAVSAATIAARIRSALSITQPDLDTSIGSPVRKMIDAFAESLSESYFETHLLTYQYDIDAKTDADLDAFCQLFGIARLAAKRATGTVVFSRVAGATTSTVFIPVNTEVRAISVDPPESVLTVASAVMEPGITSVTVPVQAIDAGPVGNLPAGAVSVVVTPVEGVGAVTNIDPISGGVGQETDTELRDRWKRTVFRGMAGTEQMFLGVALDDPDCFSANVVGSSKRRREQVQIASGAAVSQVQDATFIYSSPVAVGRDIDNGDVFLRDYDWSWDTTVNPPRVVVLNAAAMPNGTLVDLDFEYTPQASRNDPAGGITDRVDVWVGGTRAVAAQQSVVFSTALTFSASTGSKYYNQNFVRPDGVHPAVSNIFVPLAFGPIITVPATLVVGGTTYALATAANPLGTTVGSTKYAYQIVHDDTAAGYGASSLFGLEWSVASGYTPPNNTVFVVGQSGGYTYNQLIQSVQDATDRWRLVSYDARVHQAKTFALRFSLAVMYERSSSQTVVNQAIDAAIAAYLAQVGFDGVVQVSDVLQVAHNVPGVDAVRFLHGSDYSGWNPATPNAFAVGVQRVVAGAVTQSYVDTNGYALDVLFGDAELPIFSSAVKVAKAQNTFQN
jgi:uncharacterized phage protein gp47/JayE